MKKDTYILQKDLWGAKVGDEIHYLPHVRGYWLRITDGNGIVLPATVVENDTSLFIIKDNSAHFRKSDLYHCFIHSNKYKFFEQYLREGLSKWNEHRAKNSKNYQLICSENDWVVTSFVGLNKPIDNGIWLEPSMADTFLRKKDGKYHNGGNALMYEYLLSTPQYCIGSVLRKSDNITFSVYAGMEREGVMGKEVAKFRHIKIIDNRVFQEYDNTK
jgi:hypothetical protein